MMMDKTSLVMEINTFRVFINGHGVDTSMCARFAPEQFYTIFISCSCKLTSDEHVYVTAVMTKLTEIYGQKAKNILIAATVLTRYREEFKSRIDGTVVDDWLSYKTFRNILDELIIVLDKLPQRSELQNNLLDRFKSMRTMA